MSCHHANVGWYTMPDTDVEFPCGLGASGEFFFGSAAAGAAALGTDFRWTLEKVDGVGHDNGAMAGPAAALFDD